MFEWIYDPTVWVGLSTLILLEVVLGIDNLVFIAILADKLPPEQRAKARNLGLTLALIMRLGLLSIMSYIVALTNPLFNVFGHDFSTRDLIMLVGGLFLLFKGTMELHERLEPAHHHETKGVRHAIFWQVIIQIIVLDAVFSLDSVITAVGMVQHLPVMMIGVIIAMGVMMLAAKPLMAFVSRHPSVVVLCLGFLMMIGFSLVVEGLGFHIPKGYLYAAIAFSVLIEVFNQLAKRGQARFIKKRDMRESTMDVVLAMLGGTNAQVPLGDGAAMIAEQNGEDALFSDQEKSMIQEVLQLAERPSTSIMTHRTEIAYIDITESAEKIKEKVLAFEYSRMPIAKGSIDNFIGIADTIDVLRLIAAGKELDIASVMSPAWIAHERMSVLKLKNAMQAKAEQVAFLLDEYGSLVGIVTLTDILESIAGEFPDEDEEQPHLVQHPDGSWSVSGWIEIRQFTKVFGGADLVDDDNRYDTLAGYVLHILGHQPQVGEKVVDENGIEFETLQTNGRAIEILKVRQTSPETVE
jgi:CBS domain containing-hemolysin-like protein